MLAFLSHPPRPKWCGGIFGGHSDISKKTDVRFVVHSSLRGCTCVHGFQVLKRSTNSTHAPTVEKEVIRVFQSCSASQLFLHVQLKGSAHTAPLRGPLGFLSFGKPPNKERLNLADLASHKRACKAKHATCDQPLKTCFQQGSKPSES